MVELIKIGDIYQRTNYEKDDNIPNYYGVVINIEDKSITIRRLQLHNLLIHENIMWHKNSFSIYFNKIK